MNNTGGAGQRARLESGAHRRFRRLLRALAVAVFALGTVGSVSAQSLDEQVVNLLSDNCVNLGFPPSSDTSPPPGWGQHLIDACVFPTTTGGASSGGGAASAPGSTVSIQNGLVRQRLERAKRKRRGESNTTISRLFHALPDRSDALNASASDDSEGEFESRRFDFFFSGSYEDLERNLTRFEDGYDSSVMGGSVGLDYGFTNKVTAGLVAGYRKHDGDFLGGGDFKTTTFEPSLYLSVLPTPRTFLQVVAGYGSQSFDANRAARVTIDVQGDPANPRVLSGIASSGTDAKAYSAGTQFGLDFTSGSFTFGPRFAGNFSKTEIDGFTESGVSGLELRVDSRSVESLQGVVGFFGSAALSSGSGVFLPQVSIEYIHEFKDDAPIVGAQFAEDQRGPGAKTFTYQTNAPDADFFSVEAGISAVLAHGIQPFLNVRTLIGNSTFDSVGGTIGVRFEL